MRDSHLADSVRSRAYATLLRHSYVVVGKCL